MAKGNFTFFQGKNWNRVKLPRLQSKNVSDTSGRTRGTLLATLQNQRKYCQVLPAVVLDCKKNMGGIEGNSNSIKKFLLIALTWSFRTSSLHHFSRLFEKTERFTSSNRNQPKKLLKIREKRTEDTNEKCFTKLHREKLKSIVSFVYLERRGEKQFFSVITAKYCSFTHWLQTPSYWINNNLHSCRYSNNTHVRNNNKICNKNVWDFFFVHNSYYVFLLHRTEFLYVLP